MQGATVSPLLANIALHGLETAIVSSFPRGNQPLVVRYADDFVVLHSEQRIAEECAVIAQDWLKPMGLELKASKTRMAHTLEEVDGQARFDFLGFNIRQYSIRRGKSPDVSPRVARLLQKQQVTASNAGFTSAMETSWRLPTLTRS